MPGSPITTSSARIRAAGASARPRCRPSLTRSHWRRRNSWPLDDAQQLNGTQTANSACQIKSQLIHLTAAGGNQEAVEQWLKAGQRAAGRLAHVEAIAHLERGLALLQSLPESDSRDDCEIELQLALGVSYITVRGMTSPSVPEAYSRARALAEKRGHQHQLFQ